MVFSEYRKKISELSEQEKFYYIVISICILYFFTQVLNTNIGHLLAFIIIFLTIWVLLDNKQDDIESFYIDIDKKIEKLSNDKKLTEYLYIDPDVVILFDEINYDFKRYSIDIYNKSLKAANIMLLCRKAIETKLCPDPEIPFLLDNFNRNPNLKRSNKECNKMTNQGYATFLLAEKNYKICLNYLHAFIYSIPNESQILLKHQEMIERARLILKRNLDIIRKIYLKNSDLSDPQIDYYDTFVPENQATNTIGVNDNPYENTFNFY
jgi:hypothetical protein